MIDEFTALRSDVAEGAVVPAIVALTREDLERIGWSGSRTHLENVAEQLQRVPKGEVDYVMAVAAGHAVAKGGIDFAKEPDAGTIYQMATHPKLEGLGLATLLIEDFEQRTRRRGLRKLRLGVEPDNTRARRLYEYLGFEAIGESQASWEAEAEDGRRYLHSTTCIEMLKTI